MKNPLPHVVIVGGGFGGLAAAKALRKTPARITLIDRNNHHVFQPLLYQVATAVLSPGQIGSSLRGILGNQPNTMVILAEITSVDKEQQCVCASSEDPLRRSQEVTRARDAAVAQQKAAEAKLANAESNRMKIDVATIIIVTVGILGRAVVGVATSLPRISPSYLLMPAGTLKMSFSAAEDERDSANLPLGILADAALNGREPTRWPFLHYAPAPGFVGMRRAGSA